MCQKHLGDSITDVLYQQAGLIDKFICLRGMVKKCPKSVLNTVSTGIDYFLPPILALNFLVNGPKHVISSPTSTGVILGDV